MGPDYSTIIKHGMNYDKLEFIPSIKAPPIMPKPAKNKWTQVTNEFVATFGQKECKNCEGKGFVDCGSDKFTVCSCAALAFRREMIGTGRVRSHTQRIGKKDVQILEYRPIAAAP